MKKKRPGLTMSRRDNESVLISVPHPDGTKTEIFIDFMETAGRQTKFSISAPKEVRVARTELLSK